MREARYKVSEIFSSIDGEGIRSGFPVTFIRLHGCNLNCSYCDSRYACDGDDYKEMTICDIVDHVYRLGFEKVTLTGGEPLRHLHCYDLVKALIDRGYEVNIETNGSYSIAQYVDLPVILTVDYKCPSSQMEGQMYLPNLQYLRKSDVLKFVVGCEQDLNKMQDVLAEHHLECNVFVSPIFGKIDPKDIVDFLLKNHIYDVRIQLQLHKLIWDPNERGV